MKKPTAYGWIALLLAFIYKEDRMNTSVPVRKTVKPEKNRKNRKNDEKKEKKNEE